MCIVDSRDQVLRLKTVRLVLVLWRHYGVEESTWSTRTRCGPPIPSSLGMKVCGFSGGSRNFKRERRGGGGGGGRIR